MKKASLCALAGLCLAATGCRAVEFGDLDAVEHDAGDEDAGFEDTDSEDTGDEDTGDEDTGVDSDCTGQGVWYDAASDLCWEDPPHGGYELGVAQASSYCEGLLLGGLDDWRLPVIQELISLIQGCDQSDCGVVDPDCLSWWDCAGDCAVCENYAGPGDGGCFWDPALAGDCWGWYWSESYNTMDEMYEGNAWHVRFSQGAVNQDSNTMSGAVRCVRSMP